MSLYIKIISLLFFIGSSISLYASTEQKKYDIQLGMIEYVISGGGVLTNETNLTINGKGKLRFKEWGAVELFEEAVEEVTSGTVKNIETTQVCKKINNKQKLDVDFENKKILERKVPKGIKNNITEGLVKKGHEIIAGYNCDIWKNNGIRKCIYKGVPLLVEYGMLGMRYQKKAVRVTLDINTSLNQCTIPSYPVQKFALFKTNLKTKSKKLPKEFSKRLLEISKELQTELQENNITEADLTVQQKKVWLQKIGENIFQKQKELLPQFLLSMQKARVCLQQVSQWIEANTCLEDLRQLKTQFTKDKDSNIDSWRGEEKEKVLDTFDENILILESKMKCIRATQNITDLSACMK